MTHRNIDWNRTAELAASKTTYQILSALSDIIATLPNADEMDRQDGGDRGGYYRDEASIYRAELATRRAS